MFVYKLAGSPLFMTDEKLSDAEEKQMSSGKAFTVSEVDPVKAMALLYETIPKASGFEYIFEGVTVPEDVESSGASSETRESKPNSNKKKA